MSASTVKILSEPERSAVSELLLQKGAREYNKDPMVLVYLAEYYSEQKFPLRAYGYLLQAVRQKFPVSGDVLDAYAKAVKVLPDDEVRNDYEGAFAVGNELRQSNFQDAAYYLCIAASSERDKYGAAALAAADLLSSDLRFKTQSEKYYALAAQKGNPNLLPFDHENKSADARGGEEEAQYGVNAFFASNMA